MALACRIGQTTSLHVHIQNNDISTHQTPPPHDTPASDTATRACCPGAPPSGPRIVSPAFDTAFFSRGAPRFCESPCCCSARPPLCRESTATTSLSFSPSLPVFPCADTCHTPRPPGCALPTASTLSTCARRWTATAPLGPGPVRRHCCRARRMKGGGRRLAFFSALGGLRHVWSRLRTLAHRLQDLLQRTLVHLP